MNSYERLGKWLEEQQILIDNETDPAEKRCLFVNQNNTRLNYPNYIKQQLENGAYHHFCVECGNIEFARFDQKLKDKLVNDQTCFYCNLAKEKEAEHIEDPKLIIDGVVYGDAGNKPNERNKSFLGHSGHVFKIRMLDGSKEWETNNLWCGGEVRKKYRQTTMKDNAEFIYERIEWEF